MHSTDLNFIHSHDNHVAYWGAVGSKSVNITEYKLIIWLIYNLNLVYRY